MVLCGVFILFLQGTTVKKEPLAARPRRQGSGPAGRAARLGDGVVPSLGSVVTLSRPSRPFGRNSGPGPVLGGAARTRGTHDVARAPASSTTTSTVAMPAQDDAQDNSGEADAPIVLD